MDVGCMERCKWIFLGDACREADVICLQEAAASFITRLEESLGEIYHIVVPKDVDPNRDQNSLLLLRKEASPSPRLTN